MRGLHGGDDDDGEYLHPVSYHLILNTSVEY